VKWGEENGGGGETPHRSLKRRGSRGKNKGRIPGNQKIGKKSKKEG